MTEIEALFTDDAVEVFERSYTDRHADLRASRSRMPLRDCSNAACPAAGADGHPALLSAVRETGATGPTGSRSRTARSACNDRSREE
jgi:hypothetical protein